MLSSLTAWTVIALIGGMLAGRFVPSWCAPLGLITEIFLRLIRSAIAPLLVGVLVTSLARAGNLKQVGWLSLRTLIYFEVATTVALLMGFGLAVGIPTGLGITLLTTAPPTAPMSLGPILEQAVPASLFDALARGDVLQIVVFCLLFGLAANALGPRADPVVAWCAAVGQIAHRYTRFVMYLAPPAVFAAMATTMSSQGQKGLGALGQFVAISWAGQLLYAALFLLPALLLARVRLQQFAVAVREPFLVAFATTSSAAALPQAIDNLERVYPAKVVGFVLPLSLSFNLAGSTIHLVMATFFVVQAAGVELGWVRIALILLTLKLTSRGVAGIPRANFVILGSLFASFGLPAEGLALLLGVDAVIDMIRTGVNILGHCSAAAVLSSGYSEERKP